MVKCLEILQNSGFKVTRPRKKVLEILLKCKRPITMGEIFSSCTDIDFASVFRTIQLLLSLDIVREINMFDKKMRYELTKEKSHHHIHCSVCGKIESLDICILEDVKKLTDYKITNHMMEFIGICPECKAV